MGMRPMGNDVQFGNAGSTLPVFDVQGNALGSDDPAATQDPPEAATMRNGDLLLMAAVAGMWLVICERGFVSDSVQDLVKENR